MRRLVAWCWAAAAAMVLAQDAAGQCEISAIDMGGSFTYCAVGGDAWEWVGPGGFSSSDPCITPIVQGVYTLHVYDAASNTWSAGCSQGFPPLSGGPACSLSGADTVCTGESAVWCAPSGDYMVAWSGPGGFTATSRCIHPSEPGVYTLVLSDPLTGMAGEPCSKTLVTEACDDPPVRPIGCPQPVRWWGRGCRGALALAPGVWAGIAAGVDARSELWDFAGDAGGLCAVLRGSRHGHEAVNAARRQFAGVLANMVANDFEVQTADGRSVGLDERQLLDGIPGIAAGTTVGDWVARTEAALVRMGSRPRSAGDREACRRIRRQGRAINLGVSFATCAPAAQQLQDDDDDDDALADGPVNASGVPEVQVSGGVATTRTGFGVRLALTRPEWVELRVLDITGRSVRHLAAGVFAAGEHEIAWDGRDDDGRALRSGAYFVAGRTGATRIGHKLLLMR